MAPIKKYFLPYITSKHFLTSPHPPKKKKKKLMALLSFYFSLKVIAQKYFDGKPTQFYNNKCGILRRN
jgi:hypothetical protein